MLQLALFLAATVALGVDAQNYATVSCPTNTVHTMVAYPTTTAGPACTPLYSTTISGADIATIVDKHNALRRKVAQGLETQGAPGPQPSAGNMRNMTWDAELATVAQRWASQCNFTHDKCRNVARFNVGQNIYKSMSSAAGGVANWTAGIDAWYNEVASFNKSNINPFVYTSNPVIGHYTQVVWAKTYLIGCGYAYYKSSLASEVNYPYVKYMVCNYGPGGNVVGAGSSMYTNGTACSSCPAGTTCSNYLCK